MKGRDIDFKCIYCGKFVPYDRRITEVKNTQYWNGFYEDVEEETLIYHKKCEPKKSKKQHKRV